MLAGCWYFWGSEKFTYRTYWESERYRNGIIYSGTGRPGPHPSGTRGLATLFVTAQP
jgi:hypothetical protein